MLPHRWPSWLEIFYGLFLGIIILAWAFLIGALIWDHL